MQLIKTIILISTVIWLLPPIRQYKKEYFYFFLILALMDPLQIILKLFVVIYPFRLYAIFVMFLIFSVLKIKHSKKTVLIMAAAAAVNVFLSFGMSFNVLLIYLMLEHLTILIIILKNAITLFFDKSVITLFHMVLILYMLTLVLKYLVVIIDLKTGGPYFYITSTFEILIGVFFIIYNEINSPRIKLSA